MLTKLKANDSTASKLSTPERRQHEKQLGRAGRATRQPSGRRAARSARTPMTDAVIVQGCAVLAGDGLAAALDGQTVCLRAW